MFYLTCPTYAFEFLNINYQYVHVLYMSVDFDLGHMFCMVEAHVWSGIWIGNNHLQFLFAKAHTSVGFFLLVLLWIVIVRYSNMIPDVQNKRIMEILI